MTDHIALRCACAVQDNEGSCQPHHQRGNVIESPVVNLWHPVHVFLYSYSASGYWSGQLVRPPIQPHNILPLEILEGAWEW